jgi:hypothetical protein
LATKPSMAAPAGRSQAFRDIRKPSRPFYRQL